MVIKFGNNALHGKLFREKLYN